ncbi:hypothetical protein BD309DRAFT_985025, partial [Dichomitus squalens]
MFSNVGKRKDVPGQKTRRSKKARFKDIEDGTSSREVAASGSVDVQTLHVYTSTSGRLGQRSQTKQVAVDPAELVFRKPELQESPEAATLLDSAYEVDSTTLAHENNLDESSQRRRERPDLLAVCYR